MIVEPSQGDPTVAFEYGAAANYRPFTISPKFVILAQSL
jgi:hypothetical protein